MELVIHWHIEEANFPNQINKITIQFSMNLSTSFKHAYTHTHTLKYSERKIDHFHAKMKFVVYLHCVHKPHWKSRQFAAQSIFLIYTMNEC